MSATPRRDDEAGYEYSEDASGDEFVVEPTQPRAWNDASSPDPRYRTAAEHEYYEPEQYDTGQAQDYYQDADGGGYVTEHGYYDPTQEGTYYEPEDGYYETAGSEGFDDGRGGFYTRSVAPEASPEGSDLGVYGHGGDIALPIPHSPDELGIPYGLLQDLVLKETFLEGKSSTLQLSNKLALSPLLLTSMVEELRDLRLIEVQGLQGRNYIFSLTDEGRRIANDRMQISRYTGPAPVPLDTYNQVIRSQRADLHMNLKDLQESFYDLVIADDLLAELGPATMGKGAMFLYGPPGTGKSSIAERLNRVHHDKVLVPYALEVDSQVITVFDPVVVHRPAEEQPSDLDHRWILCERPFIQVGGELTGDMLDLAYQQGSGIYLAPLQMQANNGILLIDDFGRGKLTPEELLNRWIVPLDRSIDYLTLDYGVKFEVPFDAKIVFSTNLPPEALGDEAFFRRIESKVLIPAITDDQFEEVLRIVMEAKGVDVAPDAPAHLRWVSRELGDGDLRPYLPGVVARILESICDFEETPLRLDPPMVDRITAMFFTQSQS